MDAPSPRQPGTGSREIASSGTPATGAAEPDTEDRLRALLRANSAIVSELDLTNVLRRVVEAGIELSGAQYGALGVIGRNGSLERFVHVGIDDETAKAIGELPHGRGLLGALIEDPRPIRLDDIGSDPRSVGFPPNHPPMSEFLGVPVHSRERIFGNLYLANHRGGFTAEDEASAISLAATAGLAIENARLFAETQRLALAEDRRRIARDLHDHVIQQIFGAGLELQSLAGTGVAAEVADRLSKVTDDLDQAIRQIRLAIFAMTPQPDDPSLRHRVIGIVDEYAASLARPARLEFHGPVDGAVTGELAADVEAVVRECVSNVARHAQASSTSVTVGVADGAVSVEVIDDGIGGAGASRRSGIANLEERAHRRGGALTLETGTAGTRVRWTAPLG